MEKKEVVFVDGLRVFAPRENAPDWIIANLVVTVAELDQFLRKKYSAGETSLNIDIRRSKGGKYYASVSNFKPKEHPAKAQPSKTGQKDHFEGMADDIPF